MANQPEMALTGPVILLLRDWPVIGCCDQPQLIMGQLIMGNVNHLAKLIACDAHLP